MTPAPKTEYRKTGTDKVGKWTCDKYEGYQDGKKTSEVCTVDPQALGFATTDFEVTKQLAAFFQQLSKAEAGPDWALFDEAMTARSDYCRSRKSAGRRPRGSPKRFDC